MNIIRILKTINYIVNIFIGIAVLILILSLYNIIYENPNALGIWIGYVIDGISSIIGR